MCEKIVLLKEEDIFCDMFHKKLPVISKIRTPPINLGVATIFLGKGSTTFWKQSATP